MSKTKTKTKALITVLMAIALLFATPKYVWIAFATPAWQADSYGNTLVYVEVWQWNSSSQWELRGNLTNEGTVRIFHNQNTNFILCVKANSTLIPTVSNDYLRVYMNITHQNGTAIWQNAQLNYTSHTTADGFRWVKYEGVWTTALPEEGVTYNCVVDYRQYY